MWTTPIAALEVELFVMHLEKRTPIIGVSYGLDSTK